MKVDGYERFRLVNKASIGPAGIESVVDSDSVRGHRLASIGPAGIESRFAGKRCSATGASIGPAGIERGNRVGPR